MAATITATRTLADMRAEWDAPFLADPSDEAASAARGQLTRDLTAAILAAPLMTRAGDLTIYGAGWSRERGQHADATAGAGTPEWVAALGTHEHATLTSDGHAAIRDAWCECHHADVASWVRYEHWTGGGCERHGFVCGSCRRLTQTG